MATLFASMFATLGIGGGAAAGGAAAAAGAGAASSVSWLSVLSTVVGGLASIASGAMAQRAAEQQAVDEETRAVQETLNGQQEAVKALRALNQDQARILVAGYSSGIGAEGSVSSAMREATKIGEANMNMSRTNAAIQSAARRGQARQYRADGQAQMFGGLMGALKGGLSLFERFSFRG